MRTKKPVRNVGGRPPMVGARVVNIMLPPELDVALRDTAKRNHRTLSAEIRLALERHLSGAAA